MTSQQRKQADTDDLAGPAENNGVEVAENNAPTAAEKVQQKTREMLLKLDEPASKERLRRKGWRR